LLQRACACGQHTVAGGSCSACAEKGLLQRKPSNDQGVNEVPPIVHDVLRSPGHQLDTNTRSFFEPRFGHDFSQVRVHNDASASASALAVNASAYTSGNHMVFGSGRYAPEKITGKILLAHELTHVAQQKSNADDLPARSNSLTASLESEARQAAIETASGRSVRVGKSGNQPALHLSPLSDEVMQAWPLGVEQVFELLRQHAPLAIQDPDLEMWLAIYLSPAELWRAQKILEKGPEALWSAADKEELRNRNFLDALAGKQEVNQSPLKEQSPGPTQRAGKEVKPEQAKTILKLLSLEKAPVSEVSGKLESRFFVLHDTATPITAAQLEERDKPKSPAKAPQKGPLGVGYSVVKRTGETVENRKSLFEEYRPTATEWEKGEKEMDAQTRVKWMRQVWAGLNAAQRTEAINFVKTKFALTDAEVKADKQNPTAELDPANTCVPKGDEPCIHTLAGWAVERVCNTQSWVAPATTPPDKDLENKLQAGKTACGQLAPIFKLRAERVPFTTNVEIRQVGKAPFPAPFYTDEQYEGVKTLYLKAALEAGAFPKITTHFWVDREVQGHTDPRCFDMHKLNKLISKALGNNPADLYGDAPKYGIKWGEHNVWWGKDCKGEAPK
jgi:hypothetical protein